VLALAVVVVDFGVVVVVGCAVVVVRPAVVGSASAVDAVRPTVGIT
jgi:hypothetical protein